jgi:hypothetical protein
MEQWWRSWHGAPTDSKYLVVARRAGVCAGIVSAVMWALLDYASEHTPRGSIQNFDVETYAEFSGFTEADIQATIKALRDKQIVSPDGRFVSWDKRQPKREDDSTPRVREYRRRQSEALDLRYEEDETIYNTPDAIVTQGNAEKQDETPEEKREEEKREDTRAPEPPADGLPALGKANSRPSRPPTKQQEMMTALAHVCQIDIAIAGVGSHCGKVARDLLKANYTPEIVRFLGDVMWPEDQFNKEKPHALSLGEVEKKIYPAKLAYEKRNGSNGNGPAPPKPEYNPTWMGKPSPFDKLENPER